MGKINKMIAAVVNGNAGQFTAEAAFNMVRKPGGFNDELFETIQRNHHGMIASIAFKEKPDGKHITRVFYEFADGSCLAVTRFVNGPNQPPAFSIKLVKE